MNVSNDGGGLPLLIHGGITGMSSSRTSIPKDRCHPLVSRSASHVHTATAPSHVYMRICIVAILHGDRCWGIMVLPVLVFVATPGKGIE